MVAELHSALYYIASDIDCRAVMLSDEGSGFCCPKHIAGLMSHIRSIPQSIICAVKRVAAGEGLTLVVGSDIRIAARSAKFNVSFIYMAYLGCDTGTSWLLVRIVEVARAHELTLTGRVIGSDEAHRVDLVVEVVDDEEMIDAAFRKAPEIVRNTPIAVSLTREAMWALLEILARQTAIELENRQQIL